MDHAARAQRKRDLHKWVFYLGSIEVYNPILNADSAPECHNNSIIDSGVSGVSKDIGNRVVEGFSLFLRKFITLVSLQQEQYLHVQLLISASVPKVEAQRYLKSAALLVLYAALEKAKASTKRRTTLMFIEIYDYNQRQICDHKYAIIDNLYNQTMIRVNLICLLGLILSLATSKPLSGSKIVLAINCGSNGQPVESYCHQFKYQPDGKYVTGDSVDVDYHTNDDANSNDIKYTFDKTLYMFQRHTYKSMTYSLPVRSGKHTLILKFAEMYFNNPGQRVFNIKIGDRIILQNFDVVAKSGSKFAAHQQFIEIDVQNDGVYFKGEKIAKGLSGKKLQLSFVKGKADNPIVQGIIVYNDAIQNSNQQEFKNMKLKWDSQKQMQKAMKEQASLKELLLVQKKKERVVIRNDQLINENQSQGNRNVGQSNEKYGTIRSILMGPIGIIIWSALFGYSYLLAYRKIFRFEKQGQKSKAN